MTTTDNSSVEAAGPVFYDRMYDDAVSLTVEVRDYFAGKRSFRPWNGSRQAHLPR